MAALQPDVGGLPKSYATVVSSLPLPHQQPAFPSSSSHANPLPPPHANSLTEHGISGMHKGLPSIEFSDSSMSALSQPFSWALIGKFAQGYNKKEPKLGRPSVEDLHTHFVAMDFQGSFQLGLLDNRHLLIQFQLEADYLRLYSRMVWYFRGIAMRIFKWTPYFRVDKESSVVPIWITFPRLPIQFFNRSALFPIARLIGVPLRLDAATAQLKRPSVARIQVEIDVLQSRPDQIWIQMGSKEGYWQTIEYENVPPYCCHCWHLGHDARLCHVYNPQLKAHPTNLEHPRQDKLAVVNPKSKQIYVAKTPAASVDSQTPSVTTSVAVPVSSASVAVSSSTVAASVPALVAGSEPPSTTAVTPNRSTDFCSADSVHKTTAAVTSPTVPAAAVVTDSVLVQASPIAPSSSDAVLDSSAAVAHLPSSAPSASVASLSTYVDGSEPSSTAAVPVIQVSADHSLQGVVAQEIGFPAHIIEVFPPDGHATASHFVSTTTVLPQSVESVGDHSDNGKLDVRSAVQSIAVEVSAPSENDPALSVLQIAPQNEPVAPTLSSRGIIVDPPADRIHYALPLLPQVTLGTTLNPYAAAFYSPTPSEAYNSQQKTTSSTFQPIVPVISHSVHRIMGYDNPPSYNDSDESDEIDDATEDDSYDITDGSEGTIYQKQKDRKKSKARTSFQSVTREDFAEQSQILSQRLKKRGRPPGSRNRTYFDVVRTMSTRTTKSTSN